MALQNGFRDGNVGLSSARGSVDQENLAMMSYVMTNKLELMSRA